MENERIRSIRVFRGALTRAFTKKTYIVQCITIFFLAVTSVWLLGQIYNVQNVIPNANIETLAIGGTYNIGILSVKSLDVYTYSYYDEMLVGALSGTFVQAVIVWCIAVFVSGEYKNGYIKLQITKGSKRWVLFIKYILALLINIIPLILLYVVGIIVSAKLETMFSGIERQLSNPGECAILILYQSLMLLGIAVVEASLMMIFENIRWLIFLEGVVFIMPLMPVYVSMFTGGKIDVAKFSIFSAVANISTNGFDGIGTNILILLISAIVFGVIGVFTLLKRNYE